MTGSPLEIVARPAPVTVVYVAFGVDSLQLDWVPEDVPIVVVHNDCLLPRTMHGRAGVRHLGDGTNVGFGAAVNEALGSIDSPRVILCNPDTVLDRVHFEALATADDHELVTVPLREANGAPNSVVNGYWGPVGFVATALRLGRYVPRGHRSRELVSRVLGGWGRAHRESLTSVPGTWKLADRWASAAVLSLPTAPFRAVGGFDEDYFLYYEDADLQQRLAAACPTLDLRLAAVEPAVHTVGGCVDPEHAVDDVAAIRRTAAGLYAGRQIGRRWRIAEALVRAGERSAAS